MRRLFGEVEPPSRRDPTKLRSVCSNWANSASSTKGLACGFRARSGRDPINDLGLGAFANHLQIICKLYKRLIQLGTMCRISQKYRVRLIASVLLLTYGSAGVLGNGLHELWGCGHHCHKHVHAEGLVHSHQHTHSHGCHHEHADHEESNEPSRVLIAADDCAICHFLVQAQSPSVVTFETCCLGGVSLIEQPFDLSYCDPFYGTCSARAPPLS
jgi:hypothetical protein